MSHHVRSRRVGAHTGKLGIVAVVARLHPRHWDGHRLLQFLTGLALLALSFIAPAAPAVAAPAPAPVTAEAAARAVAAAEPATAAPASAEVRAADRIEPCRHG